MHSIISNRVHHIIKAKGGMTYPIVPHLEHNDYVLVDGILGAIKMETSTELAYKPIVLAQLIIPLVDTHRTNDPDALAKGGIGCTVAHIYG